MTINEHNYEEWLISFADGELNSTEAKELMNFLEANPRFKEELWLFQSLKLIPDPSLVYQDKASLYRNLSKTRLLHSRSWILSAAAVLLFLIALFIKKQAENHHRLNKVAQQLPAIRHLYPDLSRQPAPSRSSSGTIAMVKRPIHHNRDTGNSISIALQQVNDHKGHNADRYVKRKPDLAFGKKELLPSPGLQIIPLPHHLTAIRVGIPVIGTPEVILPNSGLDKNKLEPRGVSMPAEGNVKVLATIPGRGTGKLITEALKLGKFFSRNNPLEAKNDIVQVAHDELIKMNNNQ
ncbi:MAG TPA: hypothetical protein VNE41_07835 [Chitinophagaceae bacterium]|nr:hypothetical protein [Chitinophagaceae bacterium]